MFHSTVVLKFLDVTLDNAFLFDPHFINYININQINNIDYLLLIVSFFSFLEC